MENLSQGLLVAEANGELDSYKLRGANYVNHLIFTKENSKSLNALKKAFDEFTHFFGFTINQKKSGIYMSKVVDDNQSLLQIMNFPKSELPVLHLGIPLVGREL